MVGAPSLLGGKLKLFAHGALTTYKGPDVTLPLLLFHNPLPLPNSANVYGPLTTTDTERTMVVTFDGKLTYDKLQLRVFAPFGAKYVPAGLSGQPVRKSLPQDGVCTPTSNGVGGDCVDGLEVNRANRADVYDRYAVLEYRSRFARQKAGITARAYAQQFVRNFWPLQVLAPSDALQGGVAVSVDERNYRIGAGFDGDVEVTSRLRVLYGAEGFYEWKPDTVTDSIQGPGTQSTLLGPYDLDHIPLLCPRDYDPATMGLVHVPGCPLTFAYAADRTVFGAYLDPQYRPSKALIFDLGGRVQVAPASLGVLSYDVNTTLAATVVWNFVRDWHLKLNYAQGFRPPIFNATSGNGETIEIGGDPNLKVEQSEAAQAEINARIFKGEGRIRELTFRVDGSYTHMTNFISIFSGTYGNVGERATTSVELFAKLYVQGGHRLELGYTYLRGDTSDVGRLRSLPENSFSLAGVWQLIGNKLSATTTLKVNGAAEDPNRLVEYRGLRCAADNLLCKSGSSNPMDPNAATNHVNVLATDLVYDRLPPIADLTVGLQYTPTSKLAIRLTAYNALFSHAYQPDVYFDYEPHLEYLPNPYDGFRAFLSAAYQY
jgi:outer membrane receptor protein involved in Fe transport